MFILMVLVGMAFNPMNVLAYRLNDLYVSYTLFYGGLLMASNMIWAHEIYHLLAFRHFNVYVFGIIRFMLNMILCLSMFLSECTPKHFTRTMMQRPDA